MAETQTIRNSGVRARSQMKDCMTAAVEEHHEHRRLSD
jgi:hypothetical protein